MTYEIDWRPGAVEDMVALFEYLAENASLWDARNVTDRLIAATELLADYPRLYETDERYAEGLRR
ncbi:type II toxin-antitoxin system RelE/ParE family toxin, partial [Salmonella enterica]|uniref:type II toxin-antitoxin system RelE/ParE family toxin n=1 Tax=Salmonella enterica TaxID=28901 RepID=UPI000AD583C8